MIKIFLQIDDFYFSTNKMLNLTPFESKSKIISFVFNNFDLNYINATTKQESTFNDQNLTPFELKTFDIYFINLVTMQESTINDQNNFCKTTIFTFSMNNMLNLTTFESKR